MYGHPEGGREHAAQGGDAGIMEGCGRAGMEGQR